ncbi:hypothetical protein LR48_Vigan02g079200 [Vigna angularis]|uniref:Uncharacterized protein n=1 Tax=Phaseolus angularis TaxID=3914 RepID=A0A0L9TW61_PHAAN|nr:hypothetical protein LR48_Vigan02g079200 [Vigna angularis]
MAGSSKRQRVRGSSSTDGGRRRRQDSPEENSPSPSPPPSPTAEQPNLQFSTPALAERYFSLFKDRQIIEPKYLDDDYFEPETFEFYGMVKNLLEHFQVPLEDEISVPPSRHWTIARGVIQSFGLTKNADRRWVHRNSPPPPQPQNEPPPQLQLPPVQRTSRFDEVMTGINDLRTFVGDSFNSMNARFEQLELNMGDRFDTIDARVEHVEHDIQYLRRHFGPHGGPSS